MTSRVYRWGDNDMTLQQENMKRRGGLKRWIQVATEYSH